MKGSVPSGASLETPDSTQSLPISLWVDISHRDDPKQPELLRDLKRDGSLLFLCLRVHTQKTFTLPTLDGIPKTLSSVAPM